MRAANACSHEQTHYLSRTNGFKTAAFSKGKAQNSFIVFAFLRSQFAQMELCNCLWPQGKAIYILTNFTDDRLLSDFIKQNAFYSDDLFRNCSLPFSTTRRPDTDSRRNFSAQWIQGESNLHQKTVVIAIKLKGIQSKNYQNFPIISNWKYFFVQTCDVNQLNQNRTIWFLELAPEIFRFDPQTHTKINHIHRNITARISCIIRRQPLLKSAISDFRHAFG